jgi:hypothetical protein
LGKNQTLKKQIIGINTYFSIITLNVNDLTSLIKRYRLADWIKKQDPVVCCLPGKDKHRLKAKGCKKVILSK